MSDMGLTHVALPVSNLERSVAFYQKYANMQVVHHREDAVTHVNVAWLSDLTRPFTIVLIETGPIESHLRPIAHLGVGCKSREDVDQLCTEAKAEGILIEGPHDYPYPVGYWAFISDPDGHALELSHGQEVGLTVEGQKKEA